MRKAIIIIALLSLSVVIIFTLGIAAKFKTVEQQTFFDDANKSWSHRGYAKSEAKENTIEAIEKAIQFGFKGIEIDLWYKEGAFYVTHDENYNDSLLQLEKVFAKFPDALFWLDLKNLNYKNAKEIGSKLNQFQKSKESYIIESKNGIAVGMMYNKGFNTSFWLANRRGWRGFYEKTMLVFFQYNAVSMPAVDYQIKETRNIYKHLNVHLWGKNPDSSIYQLPEVKIVLNDKELELLNIYKL